MFLQTVGLMPDNIICLESSRKKVEERITEKLRQIHSSEANYNYEKSVKESVDESDLNLKAVKEVFKGFYAEIPTSNRNKSNLIDEIAV
jgi:deoxyadenosine/deoxycytidine kinase